MKSHLNRWSDTDNKIINVFLNILLLIFYPVIIVLGGIVMLFAGLLSLWQSLFPGKREIKKPEEFEADGSEQWSVFTSVNNLEIEKQFVGSLPWDSGDYFYLKSNPEIPYFKGEFFGDWLFVDFDGVFVQKWNYIQNISCDLIFIDAVSCRVIELQKGIPSKDWMAEKVGLDKIKFTFKTLNANLTNEISLAEINENRNIFLLD